MTQRRLKPSRVRLVPFKILSLLYFGEYPWLRPQSRGLLSLHLSSMAKDMRVSRGGLRDYLEWLERHGYLLELSIDRTTASVRLATPPNLEVEWELERAEAIESIQREEQLRRVLG